MCYKLKLYKIKINKKIYVIIRIKNVNCLLHLLPMENDHRKY